MFISWQKCVVCSCRKLKASLSWNSIGLTRTPTPTRTSSPTSARGSSRGCRRVRRLPRSACHESDTHDDSRRLVRRLVQHSRFSTCKRVLYTIRYTFTKLHNRRIPNVGVRVRVGPVEFQLRRTQMLLVDWPLKSSKIPFRAIHIRWPLSYILDPRATCQSIDWNSDTDTDTDIRDAPIV